MKKNVSKLILISVLIAFATESFAQDSIKVVPLDRSPADFAYYPVNIVRDRTENSAPIIRVIYSRPQKNGREIFGVLEAYGKVWRLGANESTEIKFYKDLQFAGKTIKAGSYSLFVIPEENKWTIIINSQTDKWGAFFYKPELDIARMTVPVKKSANVVEAFTIFFKEVAGAPHMFLAWDETYVEVPFTF